jgi:hypothetical protein
MDAAWQFGSFESGAVGVFTTAIAAALHRAGARASGTIRRRRQPSRAATASEALLLPVLLIMRVFSAPPGESSEGSPD